MKIVSEKSCILQVNKIRKKMRLKIYIISLLCLFCIGRSEAQNKNKKSLRQIELERDQKEFQDLKAKAVSFQNYFFGMNTRVVEAFRQCFLDDFAREIEQGEKKCSQIKQNSPKYQRLVQRLRKQKSIFKTLNNYEFSFKDGDIPEARAKKKLVEQFIQLVEEDLKTSNRN